MSSLQNCVFGCFAFDHVHGPHQGKLDPRAIKCIFIGYASDKKGYKCYHPRSRCVYISMDVTFQESKSFYPSPQLQGENNQEVESSELSVLPIIPLLQDPESSPELSVLPVIPLIQEPLMPNEDGSDIPILVHNNVERYKLQFQRKRWKGKPVLPQQV